MGAMTPLERPEAGLRPRLHTLSKSDYKLARTCAAKLFFRENGYPDNRDGDPYLVMLAEGGYMVEALAKARYPDGIQLAYGSDPAADFARTRDALRRDNVTLFEATLIAGRRQARVDILEKRGNVVRLLEVKSKSFDGAEHAQLLANGKAGAFRGVRRPHNVLGEWAEKLEDITYQVLLLEQVLPGVTIKPFLVLVDKSKTAAVDNVPSYFELVRRTRSDGSTNVDTGRYIGTAEQLAQLDLVTEVSVAEEVAMLRADVEVMAAAFEAALDAPLEVFTDGLERGSKCGKCEFRAKANGKNGFAECWGDLADASPHMLELYSLGTAKAPDRSPLVEWMIGQGTASLLDIPLDGLVSNNNNPAGVAARQRRQIEQTKLGQIYIGPDLRPNIESLHARGPIHFIDFETSRLALPYHKGMRPYGLVAFQWSAHFLDSLGSAPRHIDWLNTTDIWPNQSFAESLREAIGDEGPVLTWTHFEGTTLKQIIADLTSFEREAPELVRWMTDVFERRIVDLHDWARRDYYHPGMRGRTSIKVVLEALWKSDPVMRDQFEAWAGLPADPASDPYLALPPIEINGKLQDVHEGTGAMRAYQEMMYGADKNDPDVGAQWSELLTQYCRLDTLSMVLILEHWRRQVGLA
jgi:Domain of unknown function(DUF2779)